MSAVYFSALDALITIHLYVDEAEDLYTDLKVAIDNGNTSENINAIARRLEESIKVGRAYIEKHS